MNWFQIVFLREQSQDSTNGRVIRRRCELVSNCIFTWAITSTLIPVIPLNELWIGFRLYFYVSNHKECKAQSKGVQVVNWFQIVFLREQSQDKLPEWIDFTLLWIGFKLYFYVSNHKKRRSINTTNNVVNWFQIVFLREQSQETQKY